MQREKILEALKHAKEKSKKRNFVQTLELIVNLRDIDLKKPENRIRETLVLPNPIEKEVKVCFILDSLLSKAKEIEGIKVLSKEDLSNLTPKEIKKLANEYDFFFAEAPLMPVVARYLGKYLGPRNKMPSPIPPNAPSLQPFLERAKKMVSVKVINTPIVQIKVGTENMKEDKLIENISYAIEKIKEFCESKGVKIKNAFLKLTMGKPIKLEVR